MFSVFKAEYNIATIYRSKRNLEHMRSSNRLKAPTFSFYTSITPSCLVTFMQERHICKPANWSESHSPTHLTIRSHTQTEIFYIFKPLRVTIDPYTHSSMPGSSSRLTKLLGCWGSLRVRFNRPS